MMATVEWVVRSDAELAALLHALPQVRQRCVCELMAVRVQEGAWVLEWATGADHVAALGQALLTIGRAPATPFKADRLIALARQSPRFACAPKPGVRPKGKRLTQVYRAKDWRGHDFSGQDLRGADFSGADLRGADFTAANLEYACLHGCQIGLPADAAQWPLALFAATQNKVRNLVWAALLLLGASCVVVALLQQAGYREWSVLAGLDLCLLLFLDYLHPHCLRWLARHGTRFSGANLRSTDWLGASIGLADFSDASVQQASWRNVIWQAEPHFPASRMQQRQLRALLSKGFTGGGGLAGLDGTELNLSGLDLRGVDLGDGALRHANLSQTQLQQAILAGADLRGANLQQANLTGADLMGWQIDYTTCLQGVVCEWCQSGHQRLPTLPLQWQAGDLARCVVPALPGVCFVAHGWEELLRWLDVLLLAKPGTIRAVRRVPLSGPDEPLATPVLHIEVVPDASWQVDALCKDMWRRFQSQSAQVDDSERLLRLFQGEAIQETV